MLTKFQYVLKLIRPHHYVKNLFIFLPIFFAAKITDFSLLSDVIIAFISFSLIASSIYTLNDYCDIEQDRQHEKKKNRPLVKGVISKQEAIFIMTVLLLIGLVPISLLSFEATLVLVFYIVMNVILQNLYKLIMKDRVIETLLKK